MLLKRFVTFLLMLLLVACQPAAVSTALPTVAQVLPSPVPTDSPTPTLAPATPTATLAPAPVTFTEQFDGILPYWTYQQIDNGQPAADPATRSGFLVFDLTGPNQWIYALYNVPTYTDVRVDAQAEFRGGGSGAFGVICRYSEDQGWFEFNIYPDQSYEILYGQWLGAGLARYTPLFSSGSEKITPTANEIGLVCKGNTLTPFINGVQMRIWQDNRIGLTEGKVDISAASFENVPFTAAYDWFKVSQP
jgi:hypothetical protein